MTARMILLLIVISIIFFIKWPLVMGIIYGSCFIIMLILAWKAKIFNNENDKRYDQC